jgi:NAD(P)-dependent dehydrogenase (short-subunit alcohol dehydrogenase family)
MATNGKVAFISGGNRGIGFDTARELGKLGFLVIIGARDEAKGKAAVATLAKEGIEADSVVYDAEKPETDANVVSLIERKYKKLDVLVNNAGVLKEARGAVPTVIAGSMDELAGTFDVNFFAVVRLTRALLPLVRKAEAGRIVNVSSILGSLTLHAAKSSPIDSAKAFAYNASKSALNAFTIHLAHALKDTPIKVSSAHPGWVKTELGGSNAPLEVEGSSKTTVRLATLPADAASGGFFHENDTLPW